MNLSGAVYLLLLLRALVDSSSLLNVLLCCGEYNPYEYPVLSGEVSVLGSERVGTCARLDVPVSVDGINGGNVINDVSDYL